MPYPGIERVNEPGLEIVQAKAEHDGIVIDYVRDGAGGQAKVPHPRRGAIDDRWITQVREALR